MVQRSTIYWNTHDQSLCDTFSQNILENFAHLSPVNSLYVHMIYYTYQLITKKKVKNLISVHLLNVDPPYKYWQKLKSQEVGERKPVSNTNSMLLASEWFCIRMDREVNHFAASLTVSKVTKQCPYSTTFEE